MSDVTQGVAAPAVSDLEDIPEVLVSACLLGTPCRFDGRSKPCDLAIALRERFRVVPICPELAAGLPIPRTPSERDMAAGSGRVVSSEGEDRTEAFAAGVRATVHVAQRHRAQVAVLKAKSPACGVGQVYDGTFSGTLVPGDGVATEALRDLGIRCVTEQELQAMGLDAFSALVEGQAE